MNSILSGVVAASLLGSALNPLGVVDSSSQNPAATGSAISALVDTLGAIGSSTPRFPEAVTSSNPDYPLPVDDTITEARIVDKQPEPGLRLERWTIASPSMAREVEVQIMLPADPDAPAPQLFLLGGADSPEISHWVSEGWVPEVFADVDATVVMPTQGYASMYSDWQAEDPVLGRNMWETFLADELAPLLAAEEELNFNGHRGIGGLSMGAIGAVHLANSRPDVYDAVIGISGCYSTMDTLGKINAHGQIGMRGGDVTNMWGPVGSETWWEHDVVADPTGLRDTAVYLYAGDGSFGDADRAYYADKPAYEAAFAVIQERGSLHCTEALDQSMRAHGMDHQVTVLDREGSHNWNVFGAQLEPGWNAVREALY